MCDKVIHCYLNVDYSCEEGIRRGKHYVAEKGTHFEKSSRHLPVALRKDHGAEEKGGRAGDVASRPRLLP